jgi:hypothetical protein
VAGGEPPPERPAPPAKLRHLLRFEVMSADPMLRFYTDWPAAGAFALQ